MLKRFSEIRMKDVSICGGKGASLGEMMNAGLPIPNGFVLTTEAYGKDSKERENQVLEAFDKLNTKFVAVRSSGTKEDGVDDSFAGQFDTYLFVTRENLIKKIKECHDSVNSERIVSYCEYKGIDISSIKVAVVVQKMVNSESAGVCFTVNPVSQNPDEIMIDAGYGVGEAVVSGMITPDNYIVNKKTGEIKKNISQQEKKLVLSDRGGTKEVEIAKEEQETQKLSDKHIQELAELAKKIEKHYGKPMDTEWAIENGELFMLQARPITTLGNISSKQSLDFDGSNFQPELRKNSQIYYNYQGLPFFTSIFETCSSLEESRYSTPILYISKYTNDNKIISYLAGDFIGKGYNMINDLLNQKDDAKIFLAKKNNLVIDCIKKCEKYIDNKRTDFFNIRDDIQTAFADGRYVCNISYALQDYLNKLKESDNDLFECLQSNISPCEEIFLNKAEKYLKELVNKNPKNFDVVYKKFMEKFYWFLNSYLGTKTITKERLLNYYKVLINKKDKNAVESKKTKLPNKYKLLIETASNAVNYQDNRKKLGLIVNEIMEKWLKDVSKKINISYDDLVWLTVDEIKSYDISTKKGIRDLKNKISSYKNSGKRFWILSKNRYIDTDENLWTKVVELNSLNDDGINLKGAVGNKGKYVGKVKIVLNIDKDGKKLKKGDILVTGMTRPEFVAIMKKAGAFITDEGGVTCHAAIISRELGKPCIIGTKNATQVLKDGDFVEVDADNGVVTILENSNGEKEIETEDSNDLAKKFNELKKYKHRDIQTFNAYPFFINSVATVSAFNLLPYNLHYTQILCEYDNDTVKWHYDIKDYEKLGKIFWGKCKNTTELLKLINEYDNDYKQSEEEFNKALSTYKKSKSDENRDRLLEKSVQFLASGAGSAHVLECAGYYAEKYFTKGKIITPHDESFLSKAHKLAKKLKSKNDLKKAYKEFLKEYGRIKNTYMGRNTISIQEFSDLADEKNSKFMTQKYKKNSIEEMISYTFNRQDNRKKNIFKAIEEVDDALNQISKDTGINKKTLCFMLPNEVSKIKNKEFLLELENRRLCFMDYTTKKEHYFASQNFDNRENEENLSDLKEIKGSIGNPGKIIGTARVCQNLESINNFNEGDILVTSMTRPEFITAMRKASAFVTDEGGITCHAAIISRELGKPCIIGTKIATKVIKDGDNIEVDGDNGIIKIL